MSKFNNRPNDLTTNREGLPAYAMADRIQFENKYGRRDIGARALRA